MKKIYKYLIIFLLTVSCSPINVIDFADKLLYYNKDEVYKFYKRTRKEKRLKAPKNYILNKHNDKKHKYYVLRNNGNSDNLLLLVHGGAYERDFIQQKQVNFLVDLKNRNNLEYDNILLDYKGKKYPEQNEELSNLLDFLDGKYKKIILIGDSSGGGLILSVILKRQMENKKMPDAVILLSPWTDLKNRVKSRFLNFKNDFLLGRSSYFTSLLYSSYANKEERENIYVSPVYAEYKDFPKVLIQYGKDEILADDSIIVCKKINKDNSNCEIEYYDNVVHVFQYEKLFREKRSLAINNINKFIKKIFGSIDDKGIKNK